MGDVDYREGVGESGVENSCWEFMTVVTRVSSRVEREGATPVREKGEVVDFR